MDTAQLETSAINTEVIVTWGDSSVLHVAHVPPAQGFSVGDTTDVDGRGTTDFLIGRETLGTDWLPIVLHEQDNATVVIPADAEGELYINDEAIALSTLKAQNLLQASSTVASAYEYALAEGEQLRFSHCGFNFYVKPTRAARVIGMGGPPQIDRDFYGAIGAVSLFTAAMLTMFYFLPPASSSISIDLINADSRLTDYINLPPTLTDDVPDWIDSAEAKKDPGGDSGARAKDESGEAGKPDEARTHKRAASTNPSAVAREITRDDMKELAANTGLAQLLKQQLGTLPSVGSIFDTAGAQADFNALGALLGPQLGESGGNGGLDMIGHGVGGGGDPNSSTVGVGGLNTIGSVGGHGGPGGYGHNTGGLKTREARVPTITSKPPEVVGSLSKEVIRRTIGRHLNEVRNCYEQALQSRPDLEGRVAVKFIINASGAVQMAGVESSDLGNAATEQCIAKAVRTWIFPAPEGAGLVVVTYPFMLQQTGG